MASYKNIPLFLAVAAAGLLIYNALKPATKFIASAALPKDFQGTEDEKFYYAQFYPDKVLIDADKLAVAKSLLPNNYQAFWDKYIRNLTIGYNVSDYPPGHSDALAVTYATPKDVNSTPKTWRVVFQPSLLNNPELLAPILAHEAWHCWMLANTDVTSAGDEKTPWALQLEVAKSISPSSYAKTLALFNSIKDNPKWYW